MSKAAWMRAANMSTGSARINMDDTITIGQIGGAFGVQGEVRIKSFCAVPEDIATYGPFTSPDGCVFAQLVLTGRTKGGFTARLDGVTSKEEADALKGTALMVPRDQLPQLPDDEYYYTDLIGLSVVDTGGAVLGQVKDVHNHGASDLLEILPQNGTKTVLMPFTQAIVPTVDLAAQRIVADPPPGLFD